MLLHIVDLPRDAKYVEDNDDQGHDTKDLSKAGPSLDVVRVDRRRRLGGGLLLSRLSPGGISLFQQNSTMVFEYCDTNLESETNVNFRAIYVQFRHDICQIFYISLFSNI